MKCNHYHRQCYTKKCKNRSSSVDFFSNRLGVSEKCMIDHANRNEAMQQSSRVESDLHIICLVHDSEINRYVSDITITLPKFSADIRLVAVGKLVLAYLSRNSEKTTSQPPGRDEMAYFGVKSCKHQMNLSSRCPLPLLHMTNLNHLNLRKLYFSTD